MAAKSGFKDLLLKKGEKFALAAAAGAFALLMLMGLTGGPEKSAAQNKAELDSQTSRVRTALKNEVATGVSDPPAWVDQTGSLAPVPAADFRVSAVPFEPVIWPSLRRENPRVLKPTEGQVDVYLLPLGAKDRQFVFNEKTGDYELKTMGVLKNVTVKAEDFKGLKDNWDSIKKGKQPPKKGNNQPTPGGGRPGTGGPGMPGMGGPGMPGMGGPGMGGPGRGGDGLEGPGGYNPGPGAGRPGGLAGGAERTDKQIVEYVSFETWLKNKWREAETVHPTRMAVVQMSFPLKAQLEEIKRALRLQTLTDAIRECTPGAAVGGPAVPGGPVMPPRGGPGVDGLEGPGGVRPGGTGAASGPATLYTLAPEFLRLEVQRRRVGPDGQPVKDKGNDAEWETFDHQGLFFDYFQRFETPMFIETPKEIKYTAFDEASKKDVEVKYEIDPQMFLRMGQGLSAPLPRVADNMVLDYPPAIRLWSIHDNARRMSKLFEKEEVKDQFKKQLEKRNGDNPYSRGAQLGTQGGYGSGFGTGTDAGRGGYMPSPGSPGVPPGGPGLIGPRPGGPGTPAGGLSNTPTGLPNDPNMIGAECVLIRFLDPTILPGEGYKYRARLVMKNPNAGKKELMATDTDAEKAELESPDDWYECPDAAVVPPEFHLYAGSAKAYEANNRQLDDPKDKTKKVDAPKAFQKFAEVKEVADGKRAVVQVQWWLPQLILPGSSSQEPIGAWVNAEMPVGPGEFIGRRTMVPLPLWSSKTENYVLAQRRLAKGGILDLKPEETPPGQVVNFTTQHLLVDFEGRKSAVPAKDKDDAPEVSGELLVLRQDGTVEVLNEARAASDDGRAKRVDQWTKWVADVKTRKEEGVKPTGPGTGTGRGDER